MAPRNSVPVPFWGQTTYYMSGFSPKRDCSIKNCFTVSLVSLPKPSDRFSGLSVPGTIFSSKIIFFVSFGAPQVRGASQERCYRTSIVALAPCLLPTIANHCRTLTSVVKHCQPLPNIVKHCVCQTVSNIADFNHCQTLCCQPLSNIVKHYQTLSNIVKLSPTIGQPVKHCQPLSNIVSVNHCQTSTTVKHCVCHPLSPVVKHCQTLSHHRQPLSTIVKPWQTLSSIAKQHAAVVVAGDRDRPGGGVYITDDNTMPLCPEM